MSMSQTNNRSECHPKVQSPTTEIKVILGASKTEIDCAEDRNTVNYISWQQANSLSIEGNHITH